MRTFFYSIQKSTCATECQRQICPYRYLAKLRTVKGLEKICPLLGDASYFSQSLDTTPRNGDIIILYAKNTQDLDSMIAVKDAFEGLKKILVIADSAGVDGERYHRLAPRFITQAERDIGELEAVIQRMNGHVHSF